MDEEQLQSTWLDDESTLAAIGASLVKQPTEIEVRIPRALAAAAVEAWSRDDDGEVADLSGETCEQRMVRHRAATLALIGVSVENGGRLDGDEVLVTLSSWFIGDALNAADDRGLIQP